MYSTDSGGLHTDVDLVGLHTDVDLVGLHRDVQIEQYLALEMRLERKLGNRNIYILCKDRYAANPQI